MHRQNNSAPHVVFATAPDLKGACGGLLAMISLFAAGEACSQSASTVISVTARIVAPCTVSTIHPKSTCSEQTLSQQSDVTSTSARVSTSEDNEATVTHKGGLPPTIEKLRDRILLSF